MTFTLSRRFVWALALTFLLNQNAAQAGICPEWLLRLAGRGAPPLTTQQESAIRIAATKAELKPELFHTLYHRDRLTFQEAVDVARADQAWLVSAKHYRRNRRAGQDHAKAMLSASINRFYASATTEAGIDPVEAKALSNSLERGVPGLGVQFFNSRMGKWKSRDRLFSNVLSLYQQAKASGLDATEAANLTVTMTRPLYTAANGTTLPFIGGMLRSAREKDVAFRGHHYLKARELGVSHEDAAALILGNGAERTKIFNPLFTVDHLPFNEALAAAVAAKAGEISLVEYRKNRRAGMKHEPALLAANQDRFYAQAVEAGMGKEEAKALSQQLASTVPDLAASYFSIKKPVHGRRDSLFENLRTTYEKAKAMNLSPEVARQVTAKASPELVAVAKTTRLPVIGKFLRDRRTTAANRSFDAAVKEHEAEVRRVKNAEKLAATELSDAEKEEVLDSDGDVEAYLGFRARNFDHALSVALASGKVSETQYQAAIEAGATSSELLVAVEEAVDLNSYIERRKSGLSDKEAHEFVAGLSEADASSYGSMVGLGVTHEEAMEVLQLADSQRYLRLRQNPSVSHADAFDATSSLPGNEVDLYRDLRGTAGVTHEDAIEIVNERLPEEIIRYRRLRTQGIGHEDATARLDEA